MMAHVEDVDARCGARLPRRAPTPRNWWAFGPIAAVSIAVLTSCVAADDSSGGSSDRAVTSSLAGDEASPGSASLEDLRSDGSTVWRAVDVVDGDTLDVVAADGPARELTVRIIGINTPEIGECLADDATAALDDLVSDVDLVLVSDRSDADRFDRALRYVETVGGVDVGGVLVERGLAIARRYEPDVARHVEYTTLQDGARAAGRGVWAGDACGSALEGVSIEIEVTADAPGDDTENLNGEWVRFTNTGGATVDLRGWQVADESASNRYAFDDVELAAGASVTLYTGCGTDGGDAVYWCSEGNAVWNNAGDTVFLRDRNGTNVAVLTYPG